MDSNQIFLSYLSSLDDDYYFLIATTVLGKVPTPFHKPVLSGRILSFLLNEDNRRRILSSLDTDDRRYVGMVLLMGRISGKDLFSLFSQESFPALAERLQNLRDRMVLLCKDRFFFVNPVLVDDIQKSVFDADSLFGKETGNQAGSPLADRNVLCAMINLLINGSVPTREANAHHFLKSGKLENTFPSFEKDRIIRVYESLKNLLVKTDAVKVKAGRFIPDTEACSQLMEKDSLNLALLSISFRHTDPCSSSLMDAMGKALGILRSHSLETQLFKKMLAILLADSDAQAERVLSDMLDFGLVCEDGSRTYLNGKLPEVPAQRSALSTDTDLVVSYYGEPGAYDMLYLIGDIQVCDQMVSYRITKDSFTRALNLGISSEEINSYLQADEVSRMLFSQWESANSRVRLYDGILLQCDPLTSNIVKSHPQIQEHLVKELGEGLFLMKRSSHQIWQGIIAGALDMKNLPSPESEEPDQNTMFMQEKTITLQQPLSCHMDTTGLTDTEALRNSLMDDARRKGCLNDNVADLIRSGLIVSPSQLDKAFRYSSMQSVSGFDYNAKLTVLKNAIKGKTTLLKLELTDETIIAQPISLTKTEARNSLLKVVVVPEGIERSIPVSSMFMITVLRRTLG